MPNTIAVLLSNKCATLHELQTVYGLEDAYDMIEVLMVDAHNTRILQRQAEKNGNNS